LNNDDKGKDPDGESTLLAYMAGCNNNNAGDIQHILVAKENLEKNKTMKANGTHQSPELYILARLCTT
jgi:hypothetical protein